MTTEQKVKKLEAHLYRLIALYVWYPECLTIRADYDLRTKHYKMAILCRQSDKGRVIGKAGQHHCAVRDIVRAFCRLNGVMVELMPVQVAVDSEREEQRQYVHVPDWPRDRVQAVVEEMLSLTLKYPEDATVAITTEGEQATMIVQVSKSEERERTAWVKFALERLVNFIGLTQGCRLTVNFSHEGEEVFQQPTENYGRHAA